MKKKLSTGCQHTKLVWRTENIVDKVFYMIKYRKNAHMCSHTHSSSRTAHMPTLQRPIFSPPLISIQVREKLIISPTTAAVPLKHHATLKQVSRQSSTYLFIYLHGLLTKSNSGWLHIRQPPHAQVGISKLKALLSSVFDAASSICELQLQTGSSGVTS